MYGFHSALDCRYGSFERGIAIIAAFTHTQRGSDPVIAFFRGFLPALVFSWIYELTPEGLKRDAEVDPAQSIAKTDRSLGIVRSFLPATMREAEAHGVLARGDFVVADA